MRIFWGVLSVVIGCSLATEASAENCSGTEATQLEMNRCASGKFKEADDELNRVYRQVQTAYSDDPVFLSKLKDSQRAWIKFRDAELAMMYPALIENPNHYGSIGPMCQAMYMEKITLERVSALKKWLSGAPEGDACSGSIRSVPQVEPTEKYKK